MNMWKTVYNVHTHIGIWKHSKLVQVRNLFTFLNLRSFDMRRERHNFFNKCVAHFVDPNWSRRGETKNRLPSSRLKSQLSDSTNAQASRSSILVSPRWAPKIVFLVQSLNLNFFFFFQIPKSSVLPSMTSLTSPVSFPIWGFYCDISDCHIHPAHAWTPALNVCTKLTHALSERFSA